MAGLIVWLLDITFQTFGSNERIDQRDFDIGVANQENIRLLLGSLALYPFTELLRYVQRRFSFSSRITRPVFIRGDADGSFSMTITEFHVLVAQARAEASTPALKVRLYYNP